MKIEKIESKKIVQLKRKHSKYELLYQQLRDLPMGKALKLTLDIPIYSFPSVIYQNLRFKRTGYRLSVRRQDMTNKVWVIIKVKPKQKGR